MKDQHRATESEWHCLKARTCGDKADQVAYSTIHELLNRIEALEAAQPNHPAKPDSSLLSRVACADGPADAIREVAAWLSQESSGHLGSAEHWAIRLKQEAER